MDDTLTLEQLMVPSTDSQDVFTLDEMQSIETQPDFSKPDALGYFASIAEGFVRGNRSSSLDTMQYESLLKGEEDYYQRVRPEKIKFYDDVQKKRLDDSNWFKKATISVAEMIPAMGKGTISGVGTGAVAAGGALAAGALLPIPEEFITAPAAFATGSVLGSAQYWYRQGAGSLYGDLKDDGIPDDIARPTAHIAGALYSAIEFAQVTKFIPGGKEATKKLISSSVQNSLKNVAKKYGKDWAENVLEEGLQEVVMETAKEVSNTVAGNSNTAIGDKVSNVMVKGWDAMKDSALPMLFLLAPSMGKATADVIKEGNALPMTDVSKPEPKVSVNVTPEMEGAIDTGEPVIDIKSTDTGTIPTETTQDIKEISFVPKNEDTPWIKTVLGDNGKPVGEVVYEDNKQGQANEFSISVTDDMRRKNVGTKIVEKVFDSGINQINGFIGGSDNAKEIAIKFWEGIGGKVSKDEIGQDVVSLNKADFLSTIEQKKSQKFLSIEPTNRTSTLGDAKAKAALDINKKIVRDGMQEVPEEELARYEAITKEDQMNAVAELMTNDPELAKDIAIGRQNAPANVSSQVVFNAVKNKAIQEGDADTITELASSTVATERSLLAQKLGTAGYDNGIKEADPVRAIQEINKAGEENRQKSDAKVKELEVKLAEAEARLKEIETKKSSEKVAKKVSKKEFGADNKIFTKEGLDAARERLRNKLSGLHSGIDPTALVDFTQIGGFYFEGGLRNFSVWSAEMAKEFGDNVKPYLKDAWNNITTKINKEERKEILAEMKEKYDPALTIGDTISINKLLRNIIVEKGNIGRQGLMDSLKSELKSIGITVPERELMDAISGYGQFKALNKEEVDIILRDIRGQLQQLSKIKDLQAGKAPLKTGIERRVPSDEERALIKQVEELKKKANIKVIDPERQLKSALDSIKTRLTNQIRDLESQIKKKEKIVKGKSTVQLDAEAIELKARRDELKERFDSIFGKPQMTDAKRLAMATGSVERSIAELERRIKEKDITPNKKGIPVKETPELSALRKRRDDLKAEYQKVKDEINPPLTEEQKDLKALKKRLDNQLKAYTEKLNELDFETKARKEQPSDAETVKLRRDVDYLRTAYQTAKKIGDGISKEQSQEIVRLSKLVRDSKAAIKDNSPIASENRMAYGRSLFDYNKYVAGVKEGVSRESLLEYIKPSNFGKLFTNIAGFTKALKASFDNSVIFRQGFITMWSQPKIWAMNSARTFGDFYNSMTGKDAMREVMAEVASRPNALNGLYKKEGLDVGVTEESYPTSLPERVPILGNVFKGSQDAFTAWQYRTRADVFDKLVDVANASGADITGLGRMVNSMTGRGHLGSIEPASKWLNNIFFSPRYLKSRIDVLTAHLGDKNVGQFARVEAAKNLTKAVAGTTILLVIANALLGDDAVEEDPRSSDFGKIKVRNTRFDISGGFASMITLASRFAGYSKSTQTGIIKKLGTGEFGSRTVMDVFYDFMEGKSSPLFRMFIDYAKQSDFKGNKPTVVGEMINLLVPIPVTNAMEILSEPDGAPLLLAIIADGLGVGTNTYSANIDWERSEGKELLQFRDKVGDDRFKEANMDFNDEFKNWFDRAKSDDDYINATEEEKSEIITKKRVEIKKKIFKDYGFKYKSEKKNLPEIK